MDLAILYGRSADLHLTVQGLGRDTIVAVGPRGCGLARKKSVDIGWLLRQRLVLPSHSHGLRALIEHAAAQRKIKLDLQIEADSFRVLTSLVAEGLGFALLPPSSVYGEVAEGRLETAAISKPMTRELIFASPIDRPASTASLAVTALLRDEVAACRKDGLWDIKLS
jgi:DNA-binding transcriptional LysR family regulator